MASPIAARPRIFFTTAAVPGFQQKLAAGVPEWKELRRLTDAFLSDTSGQALTYIQDQALMYVVTGDVKYSNAAVRTMLQYAATGLTEVSKDSWYRIREVAPPVAIGYDWCYPALNLDQRTKIEAALKLWTISVWPDTNPSRAGQWGVANPATNYWWGFLVSSWLGALALGDQAMLDLSTKKWREIGLPYLQNQCAGGLIPDGTTYGMGSLQHIGWCLRAHLSATGEDLTPVWMSSAKAACFHLSAPDLKHQAALGDQSDAPGGFSRYNDRDAVLANPWPTMFDRTWLDGEKPANASVANQYQEALWLPQANGQPLTGLTNAYLAEGTGLVCLRTSWNTDAVALWVRLGTADANHADLAAGEFELRRGADALVAGTHIWSQSGTQRDAANNNCLTVDDRGQRQEWVAPTVPTVESAERYWHVSSPQMASAYDYRVSSTTKTPLIACYREFVFLKETGAVIIRDVAQKASATSVVKWNLCTLQPFTLGTGLIQGASQLWGDGLWGCAMTSVPVKLGTGGAVCSYRLEAVPAAGLFTHELFTVLQPGPTGFTPLSVTQSPGGVRVGDDEFLWNAAGQMRYIDHRMSPLDHALTALSVAVEDWESSDKATGGPEEAEVIACSKMVVATAPLPAPTDGG